MTDTKHTPDRIWATRADIIEPDPKDMFTVSMTAQDLRMYAARHKLLDALERALLSLVSVEKDGIARGYSWTLARNMARAAIAKAKGEGAQ